MFSIPIPLCEDFLLSNAFNSTYMFVVGSQGFGLFLLGLEKKLASCSSEKKGILQVNDTTNHSRFVNKCSELGVYLCRNSTALLFLFFSVVRSPYYILPR